MANDRTAPRSVSMPAKGICAHRGDIEHAPESTIPAFLMAVDKGAHMLEFDVWMTVDGALILMHDGAVDRTTDGSGTIVQMTLDEIKALDAGIKRGEQYRGTRVPTLAEALAAPIPPDVWLNIHTRDHGERDEEYIEKLVSDLDQAGRVAQTCLACFASQAERALRRLPNLAICNMTAQSHALSDYPRVTVELGARFLQLVDPPEGLKEAVALLHDHGVTINYFKADEPEAIRYLLEVGVDFVLTDRLDNGLAVWAERDWAALV